MMQMQIDGAPATVEELGGLVLSGYGAFTVMQVEDGAVRGLDLHLARLRDEAVELFGPRYSIAVQFRPCFD